MDYIPVKNKKFESRINENGITQILIPRDGILDKLVRIFKKTPTVFTVDLDKFGAYTWQLIDDKSDIHTIGNALKGKFGDEIEPVYIRTGQFMNLLKNNNLISFKKL